MKMRLCHLLFLVLCLGMISCRDDSGPKGHKSPPTARIEGGQSEANAALVVLTPKSVQRLGITTAKVKTTTSRRLRLLGADVLLPLDARRLVNAPVAGRLTVEEETPWPKVGDQVTAGATIFRLAPILTPEREVMTPTEVLDARAKQLDIVLRRTQAARDLATATAQLKAARAEFDRAKKLLLNKLGDVKRVDAARASVVAAEADEEAAKAAIAMLKFDLPAASSTTPKLIPIEAPISGIVETIAVAAGQIVPVGANLISILATDQRWIAVDFYSGEVSDMDMAAPVKVRALGSKTGEHEWLGAPLGFMVAGNAQQATTRRYYSLSGKEPMPMPGERVEVTVKRRSHGEVKTVPRGAVVFDFNGAAWIYQEVKPGSYRRLPVLIESRIGDELRLLKGPEEGVTIVVHGAAELFGTEFGTGK